jgi:two-component system cell cycle sensor histidine kinase/response regulator CckA
MSDSRTVLVVEDDPMVRALLSRLLATEGFTILAAADGEDALGVLHDNGHVALVVTDIRMPNMDGLELARHLAARTPAPPLLFISGFALAVGEQLPGLFLAKPFKPDELVAAVRSLLDGESPA